MIRKLAWLLICLINIFVSGCNSKLTNEPYSNTPMVPMSSSYPAFEMEKITHNSSDGYPAPAVPLSQAEIDTLKVIDAPITDPSMGSISGILLNGIQTTIMDNTDVYLTKGIGANSDIISPVLVGKLPSRGDIAGRTQADGTFLFSDVPPGNYFIIVSMDLSPVVTSIEENLPIMITVEKGKASNLGIVYYTAK